jgi:hypothetical protein
MLLGPSDSKPIRCSRNRAYRRGRPHFWKRGLNYSKFLMTRQGTTRPYNPPVMSLVVSKFNYFAVQMTTHDDTQILEFHAYMTLFDPASGIWLLTGCAAPRPTLGSLFVAKKKRIC